jgi:hypothetical protein
MWLVCLFAGYLDGRETPERLFSPRANCPKRASRLMSCPGAAYEVCSGHVRHEREADQRFLSDANLRPGRIPLLQQRLQQRNQQTKRTSRAGRVCRRDTPATNEQSAFQVFAFCCTSQSCRTNSRIRPHLQLAVSSGAVESARIPFAV